MTKLKHHISARITAGELEELNAYANRHGLSLTAAIRQLIQGIEKPQDAALRQEELAQEVRRLSTLLESELVSVMTDAARAVNSKISVVEGDTMYAAVALRKLIQAQNGGAELIRIINDEFTRNRQERLQGR